MNEYQKWLEQLANSPEGSPEYNHWLILEFPFLLPVTEKTAEFIEYFDYSWTMLDSMPNGWRKAFGLQMCFEIKSLLEKVNFVDQYRVVQIKEKYSGLRWYDNGVPKSIYKEFSELIDKYERLSERTCVQCGNPATKISVGWICPWCDEHIGDQYYMPIDEWFKCPDEDLMKEIDEV